MGEVALLVDFCIEVCAERVSHDGEDGYLYAMSPTADVVAVFDGCGGSGAERYELAHQKTGAYLASRIAAGATRDWFMDGGALQAEGDAATSLGERMHRYLALGQEALGQTSHIRGSLSKELPTTCAVSVARASEDGCELLCLWAGDSRCYLLDAGGLRQLSMDDVEEHDALDNLAADGILTNVVSASAPFSMHAARIAAGLPCVAFVATDGCFGYLPTPMDFEHLLLQTLCGADSPAGWEQSLRAAFDELAGDDATLCGLSMGFGSFQALQQAFGPRLREVEERYVQPLEDATPKQRRELWEDYRQRYYL